MPSNPVTITSSQITGGGSAGATLGQVTNSLMNYGGQPQDGRQPNPTFAIDAGDNRISSGPFQVGNNIYFAQSIFQGGFDVIQGGILDATTGMVTAQGLISLPNEDLLYPSIAANADGTFDGRIQRIGAEHKHQRVFRRVQCDRHERQLRSSAAQLRRPRGRLLSPRSSWRPHPLGRL